MSPWDWVGIGVLVLLLLWQVFDIMDDTREPGWLKRYWGEKW